MPVGAAITIEAIIKYARVSTEMPDTNMWCAHTTEPTTPMATIAHHHAKVAKDGFLAESGHYVAEDAEPRQDHDVDVGMAEEPEQVLEQHRIASAGGIEE